ncbi:MAG: hypothetical protein IH591_06370 [Bacteroidales bacterium]|nr:hypothetical protein [Bacteroidales bacterium]
MKKLLLLMLPMIALGFGSCNKSESLEDNGLVNQKGLILDLSLSPDQLCGIPVKFNSFTTDGINTGAGEIGIDKNQLYIGVYGKLALVSDNINIGFYRSAPTGTPEPSALHYHFTALSETWSSVFYITLPLADIIFEDGSQGVICGEQIYIVINTQILSTTGDGIVKPAWAGKSYAPFIGYIPPCCLTCDDETAWAAGIRYVKKGTWATYTPYSGIAKTVTLFAGQYMDAGTVYFTPVSDGVNIRIVLKEEWSLIDDPEAVKIQGYDIAPIASPGIGLFNTYKGRSLNVTVNAFNFFGVHLDLAHCYY